MKISRDAQAVVFIQERDTFLFLLLKRLDMDKKEDNYRLIKGGIEEGETPAQAAEREVAEEVGVTISNLGMLGSYRYTAGEVQHVVEVFLLEASEAKISIDSSSEGGFTIKEAIWVKKDEAVGKLNFKDEKNMIGVAIAKLEKLTAKRKK